MKRENDTLQILNLIAQTVLDKKGFNVLALDVRGVCTLTDYFLIAEGNVDKHVIGIGRAIVEQLKGKEEPIFHTEGFSQGDWVVIDCVEIVVHLFKPGLREKYRLEELWTEGKIVDLQLEVPAQIVRGSL
ncbi:MAG: Ribosomal silencing factor RsfS [Chlamydiales bacterium]|nr:Ribosomal silencing factor RsfS [Chlamydiales bacterium]